MRPLLAAYCDCLACPCAIQVPRAGNVCDECKAGTRCKELNDLKPTKSTLKHAVEEAAKTGPQNGDTISVGFPCVFKDSIPKRPTLVIIESPYNAPNLKGIVSNLEYARLAMKDALERGETPFASHLLYTQDGILDDLIPEQRKLGIEAGFSWGQHADRIAFYIDKGWSKGMLEALQHWSGKMRDIQVRRIGGS